MSFPLLRSSAPFTLVLLLLAVTTSVAQTPATVLAPGKILRAHKHGIHAILTTPDGSTVITAGDSDKTIKLWSLPDGKLVREFQEKDDVSALAVTPDSKTLVSASSKGITVWSLSEGKRRSVLAPEEDISKLKIGANGETVLALSRGGGGSDRIEVFSLPTMQNVAMIAMPAGVRIVNFAFVAEGTQIAVQEKSPSSIQAKTSGAAITLWTLGGELVKTLAQMSAIGEMTATPDGKLLIANCIETTAPDARTAVKVWSVPDGELVAQFGGGALRGAVVGSDNQLIAISQPRTGTVLLWSAPKRSLIGTLDSTDHLHALAISPDGQYVAAGYEFVGYGEHEKLQEQKIVLWSVSERRPWAVLQGGHTGQPSFLVFTPDSRMLVTAQEPYTKSLTVHRMGRDRFGVDMKTGGDEGIVAFWTTKPPGFRTYLSD